MNDTIQQLFKQNGLDLPVNISTVSGGSINDTFRVETNSNKYFLKVNSKSQFPLMFEAEKTGLELLSKSNFLIPKVLAVDEINDQQFLLLEWIDCSQPTGNFWEAFGFKLANMHLLSSERFGLESSNYIGSLPQKNNPTDTWSEFYRDQRLIPQINMAKQLGRLTPKMDEGFEKFFSVLEDVYPIEKPALLHGDLWSGNMMCTSKNEPCIYDPSVYFGHRELDLGIMALFGGFGNDWVDAYNEVYPLEPQWRSRIEISQLYPLMVHVNLFGGGYTESVERILSRF